MWLQLNGEFGLNPGSWGGTVQMIKQFATEMGQQFRKANMERRALIAT